MHFRPLLARLFLLAAAGVQFVAAASVPRPLPAAAPSVAIRAPLEGSEVGGEVTVSPRVVPGFDTRSIAALSLAVDGREVCLVTNKPWMATWDTLALPNGGAHRLRLVLRDKRGAAHAAPEITVRVRNVDFQIVAEAPADTPVEDRLFICGNTKALGMKYSGEWNPRLVPMERLDGRRWRTTVRVAWDAKLEYEFTRGSWATKGRDARGVVLHPRTDVKLAGTRVAHVIDTWGRDSGVSLPKKPVVAYGDDAATTMTVAWETADERVGEVRYGRAGGALDQAARGTRAARRHAVRLAGLAPATRYDYEAGGTRGTFVTAPRRGMSVPFTIVTYSDMQGNNPLTAGIVRREKPDLVLFTGDLVMDGYNNREWNEFSGWIHPLAGRVPFMTCPGNHEHEAANYYQLFPMPGNGGWYTFDYGSTRVFMLNTERDISAGSAQHAWLQRSLAAAAADRSVRWRIVGLHAPPYSDNKHQDDEVLVRDLVPLFERHGVELVIAGHEHAYQCTRPLLGGKAAPGGVVYLVKGGGGAHLYPFVSDRPALFEKKLAQVHHYCVLEVGERSIRLLARDKDGKTFHETTIRPRR